MSANSISLRSVLTSALFELDEAIKCLKRLNSSLTDGSITAGRAGTDAGFAIFVELHRYTDLLADCQQQCLAIRKSLKYLANRNAPPLVRLLNWQLVPEPIDLNTCARRLERMHAQIQKDIQVYATSMATVLRNDKEGSALAVAVFTANMKDVGKVLSSIEAARELVIEAELLQISPNSNLPEQTWDFISAKELRLLLA